MTQPVPNSLKFLTIGTLDSTQELPLPPLLRATTRSAVGAGAVDPLLAGVTVEQVFKLAAPSRGMGAGQAETLATGKGQLLAVEAEDGTTLFIRSDVLAESVARVRPEAVVDGVVDFGLFKDPNAASRGMGDVFWKAVSVLGLPKDGLVDAAKDLALKWARDKLGDLVQDKVYDEATVLGAKALMWQIESRLAGRPGLYRWHDQTLDPADRCLAGDPRLADAAAGKPMLVLIHGTASYTLGSFADLRENQDTWDKLQQRFPGGIFGFEHRTISESPSENARALLEALPKGARVSLLTHSRGGLVGDLMCLGQVDDKAIDAYQIDTTGSDDPDGLAGVASEERTRLRAIRDSLAQGQIVVERYVRVACPARGTRFLSANLDAALSDFLNLVQVGGGALVGAVASAVGGPVAGEAFGQGASSCLGVLKRLVLEIAGRRIDPRLIPGLFAMRTDSPLAMFLANPGTRRRDGIAMAVIAGDTEFDGLGLDNLRRRIANLFCDWRLFDQADNDLVVDTDSMYAGLGFQPGARYLYDQGASVTHFRYFSNLDTRNALAAWLAAEQAADLAQLNQFLPLTGASKIPWEERVPAVARGVAGPRPVAIVIPGIMGSHIEVDRKRPAEPGSGDRIWFDLVSLLLGKLSRIQYPDAGNVQAEDLYEMLYGNLADYLAASHAVVRAPYDWRHSLDRCAVELKAVVDQAVADHPGQPIRLLAHSMGGLVARTLIRNHPDTWQKVLDSGGRLLMFGTPNNGSHLMVHTLLGKSDSMRKLEKLDLSHNLQQVLDIVAGFPGALALLPRPGFLDTGSEPRIAPDDYYTQSVWNDLKDKNTDLWYPDQTCGVPVQSVLDQTRTLWNNLPRDIPNSEQVSYVFGQSDKTPCGVQRASDGRLQLLFTADGDGSVTWASGRLDNLDPDSRCWYMPVEHADLVGTEDYFPAIAELLQTGATGKLGRLPRRRGEEAPGFVLEASPPVVPGEEELARAFLGSGPRRRQTTRTRQVLRVAVRAGDLRYLDQPVLCGHYIGDAITGAEAALDGMLRNALSERERLGVYASEIGTCAVVLQPPNSEEKSRGSLHGAVVVGLGPFNGQLSARQVAETTRAAVVRFLLQMRDVIGVRPGDPVQLYSLLIGWNSTANISVVESVAAITRGVLEANRQFNDAMSRTRDHGLAVTDLCFIELFRDAAISAARAVLNLPARMEGELKAMGACIEPAAVMTECDGVLERLCTTEDLGHWSRLIVTDADAPELYCAPECYEVRCQSAMPQELLQRLCRQTQDREAGQSAADNVTPSSAAPAGTGREPYYPERLKYVFLSQRARAETEWQQRQPGLVEAIIRDQRHNPAYDAKLGRTLFQLMVPLDYKAASREQSRLLLVLDGYTANLPWELLQADDEPLVLGTAMVRQLATTRYRPTVRTANRNTACIIANPGTDGFDKRFPGGTKALIDLPAAEREGQLVSEGLRNAGWGEGDIVMTVPGAAALDVFSALYDRPYRVLMISSHGIFEAMGKDGRAYTGVVLSDGLLITAVEVSQMEVVPEVVFLSCCHLGSMSNPYSQPNRLAYSLARELIEMGVRCVVAAGWEVNDEAACTYASTFFDRLNQGDSFGDAIFAARKMANRRHPASNTWGAYQAYGDPGYKLLNKDDDEAGSRGRTLVAIEELLSALQQRQISNKHSQGDANRPGFARESQWLARLLAKCPAEWAQRPEVQQAVAALYRDLGAEGFEAAREAYLRAVQLADESGRVAVKAIEQLANIEARHAGKLADQGKYAEAWPLFDSSIHRLKALTEAVRGGQGVLRNAERDALLGSAYKLKAAALARQGAAWKAVAEALAESARCYRNTVAGDPAQSPYNSLNMLPMAWLSGTLEGAPAQAIELARRCGEQARRGYAGKKDFWNAVMSVDAEMTAWLLAGEAGTDTARRLHDQYEQAVSALPQSGREWDSVVKQWRLLARFLRLRDQGNDLAQAEVLDALADYYAQRPAEAGPAGSKPAAA